MGKRQLSYDEMVDKYVSKALASDIAYSADKVWFSCDDECGYWTDDWSSLGLVKVTEQDGSVKITPCCPHCFNPGYKVLQSKWRHIAVYDPNKMTGEEMAGFMESERSCCHKRLKMSMNDRSTKWLQENRDASTNQTS